MDSKTSIRFINGLNTIGGNIISLEKDNYRIITDFGAIGGANIHALTDSKNVQSLLDSGQLPKINGIYSSKNLLSSDLEAYENSKFSTIICLSHLHLDHLGSLGVISPDLKVYTSDDSVKFYEHLSQNGLLPNYKVRWQGVPYNHVVHHGPFRIQFKESDHDALGACAIFIESEDLKLIHSGDLRLSGFHPEKVLDWVREAHRFEPDVLLLEGTSYSRIGEEEVSLPSIEEETSSITSPSERSLLDRMKNLMIENDQSIFAIDLYPQNIQRVIRIIELAEELGRSFVLDPAYYHLVSHYLEEIPDSLCCLGESESEKKQTIDRLRKDPGSYLLQVDYERHQHLFDIPAGIYLHSNGMPLGPFMPEYEPYVSQLIDKGWTFYHAGVSGHADPQSLLTIAYSIQAKKVIPWHTFKPDLYALALKDYGIPTFLPKDMVDYTLKDLLEE